MNLDSNTVRTGLELMRVGLDAANGKADPSAIARAAVDVALEFVPVEELRDHLNAAAMARAETAADMTENARFPK